MRLIFTDRSKGEIEYGIIYGVIALIGLAGARFLPVSRIFPPCVFLGITGVPCPTCGATRSLIHLSHFDITAGLSMNPLVASAVMVAIIWLLYAAAALALSLPRPRPLFTPKERYAARIFLFVLAVANWIYLVFTL